MPKPDLKRARPWLAGFAILLALLLAIPLLVPVRPWIPKIEAAASEALREPVRIGDLGLALLPTPRVTASAIVVGSDEGVRIGEVEAVPALLSLFGTPRVVKRLVVRDARIAQAAVERIQGALAAGGGDPAAAAAAGPPAVAVREIRVSGLTLVLKAGTVGPLDGEIDLGPANEPQQGFVKTADGRMRLDFEPEGGKLRIALAARDWTVPAGPAVRFEQLGVKGMLEGTTLDLPDIDARLYGGTTRGTLRVNWAQGLKLAGDFTTADVEVRDLVPLFSPKTRVSGRLGAKTKLSADAKSPGKLAEALRVESRFDIRQGVLQGVDIAQAASLALNMKSSGGKTEFDEFSGLAVLDGKGQHLRDLKVSSGSFAAKGYVDVSRKQELSGVIEAELKKGMTLVAVPLQVSGTVGSPVLYPTKGALAGAAVGTALMGPGAGTAAGMKAGSFLDRLFGGGKK